MAAVAQLIVNSKADLGFESSHNWSMNLYYKLFKGDTNTVSFEDRVTGQGILKVEVSLYH